MRGGGQFRLDRRVETDLRHRRAHRQHRGGQRGSRHTVPDSGTHDREDRQGAQEQDGHLWSAEVDPRTQGIAQERSHTSGGSHGGEDRQLLEPGELAGRLCHESDVDRHESGAAALKGGTPHAGPGGVRETHPDRLLPGVQHLVPAGRTTAGRLPQRHRRCRRRTSRVGGVGRRRCVGSLGGVVGVGGVGRGDASVLRQEGAHRHLVLTTLSGGRDQRTAVDPGQRDHHEQPQCRLGICHEGDRRRQCTGHDRTAYVPGDRQPGIRTHQVEPLRGHTWGDRGFQHPVGLTEHQHAERGGVEHQRVKILQQYCSQNDTASEGQ